MADLIQKALNELSKQDYKHLENAPVEGFMVVKGDFILSPNESLFDLEYKKERFLKEMAQNPQLKFDYEQQKKQKSQSRPPQHHQLPAPTVQ